VDLIDYDSKDNKVYAANADDGFITAIDAVKNEVVKKIGGLGGGLEQPRYNPGDGMVYLAGARDNVLYQIDPIKDELIQTFDVGVACAPHGLAINPGTNQALLGCGNREQQHTVVWDLKAGKVLATFDHVGAGDLVTYDAKAGKFLFAAENFYRGGQLAIFSGSPIQFLTNVPTAVGSRSVAFDETNKVVYTGDQLPGEAGLLSFPLPGK
jgi:DNA-binding beta-propeller fold protein YncE